MTEAVPDTVDGTNAPGGTPLADSPPTPEMASAVSSVSEPVPGTPMGVVDKGADRGGRREGETGDARDDVDSKRGGREKDESRGWGLVAIGVMIPVLYVLSPPFVGVAYSRLRMNVPQFIETIYWPLEWLVIEFPALREIYMRYVLFVVNLFGGM